MGNWQETETHRAVEAKMRANEAARAAPPATAWGRPPWSCRHCGALALGGFRGDLGEVMAASTRLASIVWGTVDGQFIFCCGEDHWARMLKDIERGALPPGTVQRITIRGLDKAAPATPKPIDVHDPARRGVEEQERAFTCSRSGCKSRTVLWQSRPLSGGDWSPDAAALAKHLTDVANWKADGPRWYCGDYCRSLDLHDRNVTRPALGGEQAALAAMRGQIAATSTAPALTPAASFPTHAETRALRDATVAKNANGLLERPEMQGREIGPSGKPARKGAR